MAQQEASVQVKTKVLSDRLPDQQVLWSGQTGAASSSLTMLTCPRPHTG